MKSDINKINIDIDFSNIKNLRQAFKQIITDFEDGHILGKGIGGNYYQYDYRVIREGLITNSKTKESEPTINDKIKLDTKIVENVLYIPSKMNYEQLNN